jgi:hypothetical protein
LQTVHLTTIRNNNDRCPDSANTSAEIAWIWHLLTSSHLQYTVQASAASVSLSDGMGLRVGSRWLESCKTNRHVNLYSDPTVLSCFSYCEIVCRSEQRVSSAKCIWMKSRFRKGQTWWPCCGYRYHTAPVSLWCTVTLAWGKFRSHEFVNMLAIYLNAAGTGRHLYTKILHLRSSWISEHTVLTDNWISSTNLNHSKIYSRLTVFLKFM